MAEDFPSYLKSIQQQLQQTGSVSTSTPTPTPTPAPASLSSNPKVEDSAIQSKKDNLRFLLVSTHQQQFTGYSRVSHNIIREVSKNPNISITHF